MVMSEQSKPVRSRDEQIVDLGARIFVGMRNHTDSMCEAQHHTEEAEARGAAEQRRKDAEEQPARLLSIAETWFVGKIECPNMSPGGVLIAAMKAVKNRKDGEGQEPVIAQIYREGEGWGDIHLDDYPDYDEEEYPKRLLYTHPANVAALEDRVRELEGENARLKTAQFYGCDEAEGGSDDISSFFDDHEPGTILEIDGYRCVNTKWVLWDGNSPHVFDTEDEADAALAHTGTPS